MLHAFSALCKFMLLGMSVDKVVCDGQVKRNKVGLKRWILLLWMLYVKLYNSGQVKRNVVVMKQWVLLLSMFVYKVVRQQSSEEE